MDPDPPPTGDKLSSQNESVEHQLIQQGEPVNDTTSLEVVENPVINDQEQSVTTLHQVDSNDDTGTINVEPEFNQENLLSTTESSDDQHVCNSVMQGIIDGVIENHHHSSTESLPLNPTENLPQNLPSVSSLQTTNDNRLNTGGPSSLISPTGTRTNNVASTPQSFDEVFENYVKTFLETDAKDLSAYEIRSFTLRTPRNYRLLPSQYHLIFEILFKIRDVENRAVYNDTLAFINKVFEGLDYNKFILQYWMELKLRGINPIGYSFSNGQVYFDYDGVSSTHNAPPFLGVKSVEFAWSLFLDLDATMKSIFDKCVYRHYVIIFHFCILRRMSCLGEFMVDVEGKELPVFLLYVRDVLNDPEVQFNKRHYETALSLLVSVAWVPRGACCWSLINTKYVLNEIMENLEKNNEFFPLWITALQNLFHPLDNFTSIIKWRDDNTGFDKPSTFVLGFIQLFHRENSVELNEKLFDVFKIFKESVAYFRAPIDLYSFEEVPNFDWLTAYFIGSELGITNFKQAIPAALYKALPANCLEKYVPVPHMQTEETIDQALTSIFELFFTVGSNISEDLYKNLWLAYPSPPSIMDTVAQSIMSALNNLKNYQKVVFDRNFERFVFKICSYIDKSFLVPMSSFMNMDSNFIFDCQHIFVISCLVRAYIENELRGRRQFVFEDAEYYVHDLFNILFGAVQHKFNQFRDAYFDKWPPWRRDHASIMSDKTLMAICFTLDTIQKDAFCIFEMINGENKDVMEYLFFLHKKRKVLGINYLKVSERIETLFPLSDDRRESPSQYVHHNGGHENRNDRNRQHGRDAVNAEHARLVQFGDDTRRRYGNFSNGHNNQYSPTPNNDYRNPQYADRNAANEYDSANQYVERSAGFNQYGDRNNGVNQYGERSAGVNQYDNRNTANQYYDRSADNRYPR